MLKNILLMLFFLCPMVNVEGIPLDHIKIGPNKKVMAHKLESFEIKGSTRLSTSLLAKEFGLKPGAVLNDEFVMNTRRRLLGLGVFKSVILILRKGKKPGYAHLIVEVEDDDSVLGKWALGGKINITHSKDIAVIRNPNVAPMGYRTTLVGRNLFGSLHRGSLLLDFNSEGFLKEAHLKYGYPRFTIEGTQFDAEVHAIDITRRYLNALGFGGMIQGLWTSSNGDGEIQYGPAMYVNRTPRFAMPGFPKSVAGPKISYLRETRLMSFFPSSGYMFNLGLLFSISKARYSFLDLHTAKTFYPLSFFWITFDLKAMVLGIDGYSVRLENSWDFPLGNLRSSDLASLFLKFRYGTDHFKDSSTLHGYSSSIGIKYHSSAFIAELALEFAQSPEELIMDNWNKIIKGDLQ